MFPIPPKVDKPFESQVTAKWRELKPPRKRLLSQARWAGALLHKPSLRSLEIWMEGSRESAQQEAMRVLHADVAFLPDREAISPEIIRRYGLGVGSKIKDARSGKSTTKIAQVFKGDLDLVRG